MKVRNFLGSLGLLSLLSPSIAQAGAWDDAAKNYNAKIVWVENGTPLYTVASTFVKGTENLWSDYRLKNVELLGTTLCESDELLKKISSLNNDLADLTAIVADEVNDSSVARAMKLDNQMVKLVDGTNCSINPKYEVVFQCDGIRGDGAINLRAQNGLYPVAVPNDYFKLTEAPASIEAPAQTAPASTEAPAQTAPASTEAPALTASAPTESTKRNNSGKRIFDLRLIGGFRALGERGKNFRHNNYETAYKGNGIKRLGNGYNQNIDSASQLTGTGFWIGGEGTIRIGDVGYVLLRVDPSTGVDQLSISRSQRNIIRDVLDGDAAFVFTSFGPLQFGFGARYIEGKLSLQTDNQVSAETSNQALGIEGLLGLHFKKLRLDLNGSYGWGSLKTDVEVNGFSSTNDELKKLSLRSDCEYFLVDDDDGRLSSGIRFGFNENSYPEGITSQVGDSFPFKEFFWNINPYLKMGKGNLNVIFGFDTGSYSTIVSGKNFDSGNVGIEYILGGKK